MEEKTKQSEKQVKPKKARNILEWLLGEK